MKEEGVNTPHVFRGFCQWLPSPKAQSRLVKTRTRTPRLMWVRTWEDINNSKVGNVDIFPVFIGKARSSTLSQVGYGEYSREGWGEEEEKRKKGGGSPFILSRTFLKWMGPLLLPFLFSGLIWQVTIWNPMSSCECIIISICLFT